MMGGALAIAIRSLLPCGAMLVTVPVNALSAGSPSAGAARVLRTTGVSPVKARQSVRSQSGERLRGAVRRRRESVSA